MQGCFITGKEPALLGNYDPWWFDSVDSSTTRWEWESVEQTYVLLASFVEDGCGMIVLADG